MRKTYRITLENNLVFEFHFNPEHFYHLLGLEKIHDVNQLRILSKRNVFRQLLNGKLKSTTISSSVDYPKIENRVKNFEKILNLLNINKTKIIIDFDPSKVSDTKLHNTKFILYNREKCGYCHLTIGYIKYYYPETFFFEYSKRYISEQNLLEIINIEIL